MGCSSGSGLSGLFGPMHAMRKTDVDPSSDKKPGFCDFIIGLLLTGPALWIAWFIGLFLWSNIGTIAPSAIIGLCFWLCAYYGTKQSIVDLFRYRTTKAHRIIIKRRLSGLKKY